MNAEHVETLREILLSYGDQPNHFTLEKAAITAAIAALSAVSDAVREAIRKVREAELFEDGCEADLRDAGVTAIPAAYMAGRMDALDELEAALAANKPAGENE